MSSRPLLAENGARCAEKGQDGPVIRTLTMLDAENLRGVVRPQVAMGDACAGPLKGGTSLVASVCLLVQSIMGGGLLAYPHAFKASGIMNILIMQAGFLMFIATSLWVLAWCTERTGADTYQGVVLKILGRRSEIACKGFVVALVFGAAVVYLDVFVDQVHPWLVEAARHCDGPGCVPLASRLSDRRAVTIVVALLQSLLVLGHNIASLSIPSLFGFGALTYVCLMIMSNYIAGLHPSQSEPLHQPVFVPDGEPVWWQPGLKPWLSMIPVICFSYQGHISAVPLYAELKHRNMRRWLVVIVAGLLACLMLYNATGLMGYLEFVDHTRPDILESFLMPGYVPNVPEGCVSLGRIAVAMAVTVTSAVFTFCARSAILDELKQQGIISSRRSGAAFYGVTFVWVASVTLVATCVPNLGAVMSWVGNISVFFQFYFPGMCLIAISREGLGVKEAWRQPTRRMQLVVGTVFVVLGFCVLVLGLSGPILELTSSL